MMLLRFVASVFACATVMACDGPLPTLEPGVWHVVEVKSFPEDNPITDAVNACLTHPLKLNGLGLVTLVDQSPQDHCRATEVWSVEHGVEFKLLCDVDGGGRGTMDGTAEVTAADHLSIQGSVTRTHGFADSLSSPFNVTLTRTATKCSHITKP